MSLSFTLSGYGVVKDPRVPEFTVFVMEIQQGGSNNWTIYRRFDSFRVLGEQLKAYVINFPPCPPCQLYDTRFPETIEQIRSDITNWLLQLIQLPSVITSRPFEEFLITEANLAPPGLLLTRFLKQTDSLGEMEMDDMFNNTTSYDPINSFDNEKENHQLNDDLLLFEKNQTSCIIPSKSKSTSISSSSFIHPDQRKFSLDDFHLLKVIGKGSFGKVIQVRKKNTHELYALKILRKENIIKRNQVEHTRTERQVLGYVSHPFVVGMNYAFQTSDKLYFVLDYCAGGELFFHLGRVTRFHESRAKFYIAEITLALEYIHSLDIIYRDLKPENVLLDENGHIKLTDFGLSKEGIQDNFTGANSFCGTPEYLAPEILNRSGHGRAVDWWSLGALLYEMLTGLPPFYSRDRERLFEKIRKSELTFPKYLSKEAVNLLSGLLERDPTKRLGTGIEDAQEIKSHVFFRDINWDHLYNLNIPPPWKPSFSGSLDTSQFDQEFTSMPIESPDNHSSFRNKHSIRELDHLFQGFTYTEENNYL